MERSEREDGDIGECSSSDLIGKISLYEQIIASSAGALATSIIVTPMDVVKIRLQQQVRPIAQGECFLYSNGLMDHLCTNCVDPMKPLSKCEWFNRPGNFNGTLVSTYVHPSESKFCAHFYETETKVCTKFELDSIQQNEPIGTNLNLAQNIRPYTHESRDAFIKITRHEGIRSLWSGLSPTMLSAIPATVFYFTIYDNILSSLRSQIGDRIYVPLISGTVARTIAVSIVSPLELIRTKMQSHRHTYSELRNVIVRTISQEGYLSIFRGLTATLLRDIPFSAIYWTGYEYFKRRALAFTGTKKTNFVTSFLCGAGAGSIAAICTMPFDVVKTQQQITVGNVVRPAARSSTTNYANKCRRPATNAVRNSGAMSKAPMDTRSMLNVMRNLVEEKGVSSLFAGLVPRVARVAPACAIMIGSYEYLKLFFSERRAK